MSKRPRPSSSIQHPPSDGNDDDEEDVMLGIARERLARLKIPCLQESSLRYYTWEEDSGLRYLVRLVPIHKSRDYNIPVVPRGTQLVEPLGSNQRFGNEKTVVLAQTSNLRPLVERRVPKLIARYVQQQTHQMNLAPTHALVLKLELQRIWKQRIRQEKIREETLLLSSQDRDNLKPIESSDEEPDLSEPMTQTLDDFSDKKVGVLRAGDTLEYTHPIYRFGDKRGLRTAQIIAIQADNKVKMSSGDLLEDDIFVKRCVGDKTPKYRPLSKFLLVEGAAASSEGAVAKALREEGQRIGKIIDKHTTNAMAKLKKATGFAPTDMVRSFSRKPKSSSKVMEDSDSDDSGVHVVVSKKSTVTKRTAGKAKSSWKNSTTGSKSIYSDSDTSSSDEDDSGVTTSGHKRIQKLQSKQDSLMIESDSDDDYEKMSGSYSKSAARKAFENVTSASRSISIVPSSSLLHESTRPAASNVTSIDSISSSSESESARDSLPLTKRYKNTSGRSSKVACPTRKSSSKVHQIRKPSPPAKVKNPRRSKKDELDFDTDSDSDCIESQTKRDSTERLSKHTETKIIRFTKSSSERRPLSSASASRPRSSMTNPIRTATSSSANFSITKTTTANSTRPSRTATTTTKASAPLRSIASRTLNSQHSVHSSSSSNLSPKHSRYGTAAAVEKTKGNARSLTLELSSSDDSDFQDYLPEKAFSKKRKANENILAVDQNLSLLNKPRTVVAKSPPSSHLKKVPNKHNPPTTKSKINQQPIETIDDSGFSSDESVGAQRRKRRRLDRSQKLQLKRRSYFPGNESYL